MTTLTFDTHAYVKRLKEAGFTETQAEAQASALIEALKSGVSELATRADIDRLAERTDGRFKLLQWMIGFDLALTLAVLFLLLRH
jgi:hypothetical protein